MLSRVPRGSTPHIYAGPAQFLYWTRNLLVAMAWQVHATNQLEEGFLGSQSEPREVTSPRGALCGRGDVSQSPECP